MFFRSYKSILLGPVLIAVGGVLLIIGWSQMEVSKREASTVGTLVRVECGRGCTYAYIFNVNGVAIRDDSGSCETALTKAGCVKGAPVLVYYDPKQVSGSLLQEFKSAGREKLFLGSWLLGIGLLAFGLRSFFNRKSAGSNDSEAAEQDQPADESEVIHVVPSG